MKITVITSCTGEKKHSPDNQLRQEDFRVLDDERKFRAREDELRDYSTPAEELYTGQQHLRLMQGINIWREKFGKENLSLWILSAGYGVIPGNKEIAPYECTFQGMKSAELKTWAEHLKVSQTASEIFGLDADLILVLLGDSYLKALNLNDEFEFRCPTIFLTSNGSQKLVRGKGHKITVPLSNKEAKRFSCGLVALKGELGSRILKRLSSEDARFKEKLINISDVLSLLEEDKVISNKVAIGTPKENPNVDRVISIPKEWWEKPHRSKLRYFIPEWDDLVDPDYDFETDTHSGGSGDWSNETYAHQMYPEPNYDGILISKVVAEKSVKKKERINRLGVHRFLRVPDNFPIMGDCGAFGYIMDEVPPYTTAEILEYYTRLGFNYGVSLDHLIVKATEDQKQFRYDLTINNAEEFFSEG